VGHHKKLLESLRAISFKGYKTLPLSTFLQHKGNKTVCQSKFRIWQLMEAAIRVYSSTSVQNIFLFTLNVVSLQHISKSTVHDGGR
jgi:hypothetical protein